jgi:predicted NAD/FAD-binding protein
MKVAIVGTGISGNTLAYLLSKHKQISLTIFESDERIGGHTHTHKIKVNNQKINVDTGFIVFNKKTYPLFTKLLKSFKNVD